MTSLEAFFEHGSRMLTHGAFEFALNLDLKRAARTQDFLTLLLFETLREWETMTFAADDGMLREVAQAVDEGIRSTDLFGRADQSMIAILLVDCGVEQSERVVARLVSRLESYNFSKPLRIVIGAAGFPVHAMDAAALKRQAMASPTVNLRGGSGPGGTRVVAFPTTN